MMAMCDCVSSSRRCPSMANAEQGPIKCSQGNLGRKGVCHVKEKKNIDNCQEDQDAVLGLRGSLIYK